MLAGRREIHVTGELNTMDNNLTVEDPEIGKTETENFGT